MTYDFNTIGALIGLVIAIILIIKKVHPAYSLILGALVGVFIDISVITVAPIALAIGKKANISKESLLLAMIGGGKAGNIISPNPNTIAASEAFNVDLTSLMLKI